MDVGGSSVFHKVGPNDSGPKHVLGRGQIEVREKSATPRNDAVF
jgi:hypothetical protein